MTLYFKDTYFAFRESDLFYLKILHCFETYYYIKIFVVHIIVVFFPNGEMIKGNDNKWYIFDITVVSARL